MIGLIQRVTQASVVVNQETVGAIDQGILALIGVEKTDTVQSAQRLIDRILSYRIFSDEAGKMNLSLADVRGGLLLVSQFTLVADTQKGARPSFSSAAPPAQGKQLFEHALAYARQQHTEVASGIFGADMQVSLMNDGPVTFILNVN